MTNHAESIKTPSGSTRLDTALTALQIDTAKFSALQKTTWQEERHLMAVIYFWWRDARCEDGYLEACYEKADITFNKTKRDVNFRPLLRLVNSNQISENELTQWSKALLAIHADFEGNPEHYAIDPVEKIEYFIKNNGGKTGLAGYFKKQPLDDLDADDELDESLLFNLNDKEFSPTLRQEAEAFYGKSTAIQSSHYPPLYTTADGFSVVVVKQGSQGLQVIGSLNDTDFVDSALVNTYRDDLSALPLTMRCVLETLHVLNIPNILATSFAKFKEASGTEKGHKRLIYRPKTADFLLSCTQASSSVVLIATPKSPILPRESGDIFLPTSTRQSVEVRLLHQRMFNLFKPSAATVFNPVQAGIASHYVTLNTKLAVDDIDGITSEQVEQHTENLNHPPLSFIPFHAIFGKPQWQTDIKSGDFTADWQAIVTLHWLRDAASAFFDRWIVEYGKKANRPVNKTLNLWFSDAELLVGYEFDKALGYDNALALEFPSNCSSGAIALTVCSIDFAFTLRQIAALNICGGITMSANAEVLHLAFETEANAYTCSIPSAAENGKRNPAAFVAYHPEQSEEIAWELDWDDLTPEPTEEEMSKIKANIERVRNATKS